MSPGSASVATLYIGQFFGALGMLIAGLAPQRRDVPWVNSRDFNVEYFLPAAQGIMTHHVSERETRRIAGRDQQLALDRFRLGQFLFSWTLAWFIDPRHPSTSLPQDIIWQLRSVHRDADGKGYQNNRNFLPKNPRFQIAFLMSCARRRHFRKVSRRADALRPDDPL